MTHTIFVREATVNDVDQIIRLIRILAESYGEHSPVSAGYVVEYLSIPGCGILLAQQSEEVTGLLSYSIRPDLYHAGDTCRIDELVVAAEFRSQGVGSALLSELMKRLQDRRCVEVSVSVIPDNLRAQNFYRSHGLIEQVIFLEKHIGIENE